MLFGVCFKRLVGYTKMRYTKRIERKRLTKVQTASKSIRTMLESFIQGDRASAIAMLNQVRPLDVARHIMGRRLSIDESTLYLQPLSGVPEYLQEAFKLAKVWQDLTQGARKHLQGLGSEDDEEVVKRFRSFLDRVWGI